MRRACAGPRYRDVGGPAVRARDPAVRGRWQGDASLLRPDDVIACVRRPAEQPAGAASLALAGFRRPPARAPDECAASARTASRVCSASFSDGTTAPRHSLYGQRRPRPLRAQGPACPGWTQSVYIRCADTTLPPPSHHSIPSHPTPAQPNRVLFFFVPMRLFFAVAALTVAGYASALFTGNWTVPKEITAGNQVRRHAALIYSPSSCKYA